LQTRRNRLEKGTLSKAARGELFLDVPVGSVTTPAGELALDPDEQVRAVVALIFDQFEELGTVYAVYRYLLRNTIRLGLRPHNGPHKGELEWRRPCLPTLYKILHHPLLRRYVCLRPLPDRPETPACASLAQGQEVGPR
jgi:hypothetical protein